MITLSSAIICLAMAVYHESRDQPDYAQFRVAQTVMHRTNQRNKEICSVVRHPAQFSWVKEGRYGKVPKEKDAWEKAKRIAKLTMNGYYVNIKTMPDHFWSKENGKEFTPYWAKDCVWRERVKDMTFCRINKRKDPEVKKVIAVTDAEKYAVALSKPAPKVEIKEVEKQDPVYALLLLKSFLGAAL